MNEDKGFRLLAIRPLKNCSEKFRKNLIEGEIYSFYNNYTFNKESENDFYSNVSKIEKSCDVPVDIYSSEFLTINISAIVGKNGSGKSSLLELFFCLIYLASVENKFIDEPEDSLSKQIFDKLKRDLKVEIYFELDSSIRCLSYKSKLEGAEYKVLKYSNSKEKRENKIDYLLSNNKDLDFSNLFYTIAVNYSIYGLNTLYLGNWINELFHKNDAYQTPIVINPMRTKGNFDINDENYLLKSRLLANVLTLDDDNLIFDEIIPNRKVSALNFKCNHQKVRFVKEEHPPNMNPIYWKFETIYRHFGNGDAVKGEEKISEILFEILIRKDKERCTQEFRDEVKRYIIKKLHKIAMTYPDYRRFLTSDLPNDSYVYSDEGEAPYPMFFLDGENSFENFLNEVKKEKSHITFKLDQAINYLKYDVLYQEGDLTWTLDDNFSISPIRLALRMKKNLKKDSKIINFIPPSLFDVDIYLQDINLHGSYKIESMSSGEQQLIQSIQSIVYHVRNINSVFNKNPDSVDETTGKPRIAYQSINIILDEIELYYHPDFQKDYISYLLFSLKQIKFDSADQDRVKNINFLFSTHSPFILSDLLPNNVLSLKRNAEGKSEPCSSFRYTFGSNIHDLLRDSFFMEDGFIGKFSRQKIDDVFKDLKKGKDGISDTRKDEIEKTITIIGEPLIKRQLSRMYDNLFNEDLEIEAIDEQIKRLKEFKNRKKKTNDKDK